MNGFGFQVYTDSTMAEMIADWTHLVQGVVPETDDHGYANLKAFIPMSTGEAFRIYESLHFAHVVLSAYGFHAFEGRIEDANMKNGGIEITALGYWRSMYDLVYHALWSTKSYAEWRALNVGDISGSTPNKFTIDNNHRLFIGQRKNETYAASGDNGRIGFSLPDNSFRDMVKVTFDYTLVGENTNFKARLISQTGFNFSGSTTEEWTLATTNGTQSSSASETLIGTTPRSIFFQLDEDTTGTTTSADTGDLYLEITNLRVFTTSSSNVYADEVINALISFVNTNNSSQLGSSTALVESPTVDLIESIYESEIIANIINKLCDLGDGTNRYEAGVWENQTLHYRPVGSQGQTWYIDIADINLQSTVDELYNRVYATYVDENNYRRKVATSSSDAISLSKYGVLRAHKIEVKTTSSTEATEWQDIYLEDHKDITPKTKIVVDRIFSENGAMVPIWYPRASDTIVIRNLPPTAGEAVDKIRRFICTRTSCNLENGTLTLTPAEPIDSLDILVAKHEVTYVNG